MEINQQCVVALTWTLTDTLGEQLDVLEQPVEFLVGGDDLFKVIEQALVPQANGPKARQRRLWRRSGTSGCIARIPGRNHSQQLTRLSSLHSRPVIGCGYIWGIHLAPSNPGYWINTQFTGFYRML